MDRKQRFNIYAKFDVGGTGAYSCISLEDYFHSIKVS